MTERRYVATGSAGVRDGKQYAVIDRWTSERVSWFSTYRAAQQRANRLNQRALNTEGGESNGPDDEDFDPDDREYARAYWDYYFESREAT